MKYNILKETLLYQGFLRIKEGLITHDRFDGTSPLQYTREALDKGDFAAALLYEKDTQQLILIKQFRYPVTKNGDDWVLEIAAGGVEKGEDPEECIIREIQEETGYEAKNLEHVCTCYTSPGVSSERMYLYYVEVVSEDKKHEGGGALDEGEDIQVVKYNRATIKDLLSSGHVNDAKLIIALQWFLLHK